MNNHNRNIYLIFKRLVVPQNKKYFIIIYRQNAFKNEIIIIWYILY